MGKEKKRKQKIKILNFQVFHCLGFARRKIRKSSGRLMLSIELVLGKFVSLSLNLVLFSRESVSPQTKQS